jgi:DNA-binding XRE family transcriptional regulator
VANKTIYNKSHCARAESLCREAGLTDAQLAKAFGISRQTLATWKTSHPEFKTAVQSGKDAHDSEVVEQSLLKRAKGYRVKEITRERALPVQLKPGQLDDFDFDPGVNKSAPGSNIPTAAAPSAVLVTTKEVMKHIPADVTAIIFFLKNRHPERWREKSQVELPQLDAILEAMREGNKRRAEERAAKRSS